MPSTAIVEIACPYCDKPHSVELTQEQLEWFDGFHPCANCEAEFQAHVNQWTDEHVAWVTKYW